MRGKRKIARNNVASGAAKIASYNYWPINFLPLGLKYRLPPPPKKKQQQHTIGLSESITVKIINQSNFALGFETIIIYIFLKTPIRFGSVVTKK